MILSSLRISVRVSCRICVQLEVFSAHRVGHGLEVVPWPIAHERRLNFGENTKTIDRTSFEFFKGDIVEWGPIVAAKYKFQQALEDI
jgi:hypothetical protein